MKHIRKVIIAVAFLMLSGIATVWVTAFDIRESYARAKEKAAETVTAAKERFSQVIPTGAKEGISGMISQGMGYFAGESIAVKTNPYKDTIAYVRMGNQLHSQERDYLDKRRPKVKIALEKMLQRSLDEKYIPTIAIVGSGGGYRAMLGTIGSLSAAEKIGFLDATTYITALSGTTWAIAPWISTGMPLAQFKNYIQQTIVNDIKVASIDEAQKIMGMLSTKIAFDEPITGVDIYGGLLANRLLSYYGADSQRVYLSQQAERIKNADVPYPIYTAIDAREAVAREPHWFEYTPHEIGSPYFGVYVPTWAYGRLFDKGKSIDFAPEQSLGFLMGTWGSAFGVHVGRAWEEIVEKIPTTFLKEIIEKKLIDPLSGKRINYSWGEIFNFTYGMERQELATRKTIKFVDAGVDFNLPYPAVSGERPERIADIMIFLDFSGDSLAYSMKKIEEYARKRNLKFPKIEYAMLEKKAMSIFMDPTDASVPVVIYFPRISQEGLWQQHKSNVAFSSYSSIEGFDFAQCTNEAGQDCVTQRFKYIPTVSQQIMDQMEFNIMVHKEEIIKTINGVIDQKSR